VRDKIKGGSFPRENILRRPGRWTVLLELLQKHRLSVRSSTAAPGGEVIRMVLLSFTGTVSEFRS